MLTLISQACLLGFAALLLAVAVSDIRIQRIPNLYVLGIVLLYPLFVLTAPQAIDWRSGLVCFGAVLAVGFVLSSVLRLMGAGDAKLLAAAALWTDGKLIVPFLMITAISGGMFAAYLLLRRYAKARSAHGPALADAALGADAGVTIGDMTMPGATARRKEFQLVLRRRKSAATAAKMGPKERGIAFLWYCHTERPSPSAGSPLPLCCK